MGSVGVASFMADAMAYAVVAQEGDATENAEATRLSGGVIGGAEAPKRIAMEQGAANEHAVIHLKIKCSLCLQTMD